MPRRYMLFPEYQFFGTISPLRDNTRRWSISGVRIRFGIWSMAKGTQHPWQGRGLELQTTFAAASQHFERAHRDARRL